MTVADFVLPVYALWFYWSQEAQLFNDYFYSIATLDNDNKYIPYMTDRGPGILTEITVTEQDTNDIISCLDPQKASGPDYISHIC